MILSQPNPSLRTSSKVRNITSTRSANLQHRPYKFSPQAQFAIHCAYVITAIYRFSQRPNEILCTWRRSAVKWGVVHEPVRPWPIESKGLCERAVLSEGQFSVACTPKDSAGRAKPVFGFNGNHPYSSTALLIHYSAARYISCITNCWQHFGGYAGCMQLQLCIDSFLLFYVRFYDADLHLLLCALEVVASGTDDIIVQTLINLDPAFSPPPFVLLISTVISPR
jgi:hypothetical protein